MYPYESLAFLKSVLLPALESNNAIKNHSVLNQLAQSNSDDYFEDSLEDSLSDTEQPNATEVNKVEVGDLFNKNSYFITLNMIGEQISMPDKPPFYLTIISRDNQSHLTLDQHLDNIAKNGSQNCIFEHDLTIFKGQPFQDWVEKIELNETNLKFLKNLFLDNQEICTLLEKVEKKLLGFNASNEGLQTLIKNLTTRDKVEILDPMTSYPAENNTLYLHSNIKTAEFENLTADQLLEILSSLSYVYISLSSEEYSLISSYFSQEGKNDYIKVFQSEPLIAAIKFVNINEAGAIFLNDLFREDKPYLSTPVKEKLHAQIEELRTIHEDFNEAYKKKLKSYYQKRLEGDPKSTNIILNATRKPSECSGFQSEVNFYKIQCQAGFFLKDQMQSGLRESILELSGIEIPIDIFQENTDSILANMDFYDLSSRFQERKKMDAGENSPAVYKGWDFGLTFTEFDPVLNEIYCNKGENLKDDNLALAIPIMNFALYYILRYLDTLQQTKQVEMFNQILIAAKDFILNNNLCLPEKYHAMFLKSEMILSSEKKTIYECYDSQLMQQVEQRKEIEFKQDQDDEMAVVEIDSDIEEVKEVSEISNYSSSSSRFFQSTTEPDKLPLSTNIDSNEVTPVTEALNGRPK